MAYAIIDFETTGVMPERGDRVVEVGVVLADDVGQIEHEWTTLINPKRDVGASHIHGLTASDLLDAPEFGDIGDDLLELAAGRTVVAHNATFDMRFLHSELTRAGYEIDERPAALCTMKWSGRLIGPAKLEHCCQALGITLVDAHAALHDARATAELMSRLLTMRGSGDDWELDVKRSAEFGWPAPMGRSGMVRLQRGESSTHPYAWLDSVLEAAWIPGVPEDEASYLLVLDRALLDRSISLTEGRELNETARSAGLSAATVVRLHGDYLRSVAAEALADGVVTPEERADLAAVASALRLTSYDVDAALEWARTVATGGDEASTGFQLQPGDRIVFTGEMRRQRDEWVSEIVAAGLVSGGVTKSTKLLVTADVDSMSGKAAKARSYGIPVVSEDAFARFFDAYCAGR